MGIAARVAHRLGLPHPLESTTAALAAAWLRQRVRFDEVGVPHDSWLGDGPETTVHAFSLAGEFYAMSGAVEAAGLAERAATVLGIREGPTCTRVRMMSAGPQVIELAARLGGPAEVETVREETGIDLNALALKAALGEPIARDELAASRLAA